MEIKNAKVLIVEDEGIIAMDIQSTLLSFGYENTKIVHSGEETIKQVEKFKPDLVLMDIMIKGEFDGIEAADIIKECYNVPVIYLTAYSTDTMIERAKQTSPDGYLLKPFKKDELKAAVELVLHKKRW